MKKLEYFAYRSWTLEEENTLRELWARTPEKEVAKTLRKSVASVKSRARKLGLIKDQDFRGIWTKEQEQLLRELYPTGRNEDLAELFGVSKHSIVLRACKMGVKKSKAYLSYLSRQTSRESGFKKNHKVWNKGIKGLNLGGVATQFKAGQLPQNTKEDGHISIRFDNRHRPALFIRESVNKWIPLSHHIFRQYYGDIPEGRIIRFKNGNALDCRLENLECISRQENGLRNSGSISLSDTFVLKTLSLKDRELREVIKQEAPELIELKRNLLKLKRECKTT